MVIGGFDSSDRLVGVIIVMISMVIISFIIDIIITKVLVIAAVE